MMPYPRYPDKPLPPPPAPWEPPLAFKALVGYPIVALFLLAFAWMVVGTIINSTFLQHVLGLLLLGVAGVAFMALFGVVVSSGCHLCDRLLGTSLCKKEVK